MRGPGQEGVWGRARCLLGGSMRRAFAGAGGRRPLQPPRPPRTGGLSPSTSPQDSRGDQLSTHGRCTVAMESPRAPRSRGESVLPGPTG